MIAPDTNVLVRFLVRDDIEQHRRAAALLRAGPDGGETFFVADVVLAEIVWVLGSRYRLGRSAIADAVHALLEAEHLVFESTERCYRALRRYQQGPGGMADYLIVETARDAGCDHLATFDRALGSESDVMPV